MVMGLLLLLLLLLGLFGLVFQSKRGPSTSGTTSATIIVNEQGQS